MKTILSITIFILVSLTAFGKTYEAEALLKNGNVVQGKAILPMNMSIQIGNINFTSDTGKKIKSEDINQVTYHYSENQSATFERLSALEVTKSYAKQKEDCADKRKFWMLVLFSSEKLSAYSVAENYYVDKKGNLISEYDGGYLNLLLKTPVEECAAIVDRIFTVPFYNGRDKALRKKLVIFFEENPALVEEINRKTFDDLTFVELAKKLSESL